MGLGNELRESIHPARSKIRFNLKVSVSDDYFSLLEGNYRIDSQSPDDLLNTGWLRKLIIHAPGGYGKTALLCNIAESGMRLGYSVFWIGLGSGELTLKKSNQIGLMAILNDCSHFRTYQDFTDDIASGEKVLMLVDGLNEVNNATSDAVLNSLGKALRKYSNLKIFVSDRMNPHDGQKFYRAIVDPLESLEISRHFKFSLRLFTDVEMQLVSIPFFLDLFVVLTQEMAQWKTSLKSKMSRKSMFFRYFERVVGLDHEEMSELSNASKNAYEKFGGNSFGEDWFRANMSQPIQKKLEESGSILFFNIRKKSQCMFRHQLFHDFLVGYYLSTLGSDQWSNTLLDIATLKSSSVESLSFATEIVESNITEYLIRIYDWNYRTISRCIQDFRLYGVDTDFPKDFEFAIYAKDAEKKFEIFDHTKEAAMERLAESTSEFAKIFQEVKTMKNLMKIVSDYEPDFHQFQDWKRIFLWESESQISKSDVEDGIYGNPLISWTTSNSLRRMNGSEWIEEILRQTYRSSEDSVVKWKAIHALGAFGQQETIKLMFEALYNDESDWVKYGAVRGLMEVAAKNSLPNVRNQIVQGLLEYLPKCTTALVIREVRRTCLVQGADPSWYATILPLVKVVKGLEPAKLESLLWDDLVVTIKSRA